MSPPARTLYGRPPPSQNFESAASSVVGPRRGFMAVLVRGADGQAGDAGADRRPVAATLRRESGAGCVVHASALQTPSASATSVATVGARMVVGVGSLGT